jgi:hypothetical protein
MDFEQCPSAQILLSFPIYCVHHLKLLDHPWGFRCAEFCLHFDNVGLLLGRGIAFTISLHKSL